MFEESGLVTVIVPCFNCENYVQEAVTSILDQTYQNIEIIVVNDGSTDASLDKLQMLQKQSPNIKIINQDNAGAAAAKNRGLREAQGEFISFLDADDYWHPKKVEFQVRAFNQKPECSICFCDFLIWPIQDDKRFQSPSELFDLSVDEFQLDAEFCGWIYHLLLLDAHVSTITVMFRRQAIEDVGCFDTGLKVGEDHDYWLRAAAHYKFIKVGLPLSLYRKYGASITGKVHDENYSLQVFERSIQRFGLKSQDGQGLSLDEANEHRFYLSFRYGYQCFWGGDAVKARQSFRKALRIKNSFKVWSYTLLTYPVMYKLMRSLYHPTRGFIPSR